MAWHDVRTILCPIDFSDASEGALRAAADLAARNGARLTLLHVAQVPGSTIPEALLETPASLATDPEAPDAGPLAGWKARAEGLGATGVEVLRSVGDPASEIVAAAAAFDLVVLGTHGRTGARRLLAGSVAEEVVRSAPCPVLTIGLAAARRVTT